jgi:hypothetical protein
MLPRSREAKAARRWKNDFHEIVNWLCHSRQGKRLLKVQAHRAERRLSRKLEELAAEDAA